MKYWLIKSEPKVFSIDDLMIAKKQTTFWDGVRNYQARNYLRDEMKQKDKVIFYHSNSEPPAAAGVCEIVKEGYPDFTAFDPDNKHYDPKSSPNSPAWFMVDVKFIAKFSKQISLDEMRKNPKLSDMKLLQRGSRLSIMPISKDEFDQIVKMGK